MRVAYIRVSTEEQNTARQEELMKSQSVEKIFLEKVSGKNTDRPQLKAMLDYVREGDCIITESYSRLARSTADLLNIVNELNSKGVSFISLKENINTNSPEGKFMMTVFAGLAEFERECILQRQKEGIAIARSRGAYKGRKPIAKPDCWDSVIADWKTGRITAVEAMRKVGMTAPTFYRKVKEN